MENIKLLTGNSNEYLATLIADRLGIDLCKSTVDKFSNSEIRVKINENIRKKHIYIIQTGSKTNSFSVNDHLMETLILIDACKRSNAKSITVVLACYPYSRQDKKDRSRAPISASLVAKMLETAGATRIMCIDLHADQIQGMFQIPVDNLTAENTIIKYLNTPGVFSKAINSISLNGIISRDDVCIVSPDAGGAKRACSIAEKLKVPVVMIHKERNYKEINKVDKMILVGGKQCVKNKTCIIIDDMADTMGTMCLAARTLVQNGACNVVAVVTHGVLSGPAMERINDTEEITKVIVSNTLPQKENLEKCEKLLQFDISELIANAIKAIVYGGSISALFE